MLQVLLIALSDVDHNEDDHDTFEDIPVILMFKHTAVADTFSLIDTQLFN